MADLLNQILGDLLGHITNIATSTLNISLASILGALTGKRDLSGLLAQIQPLLNVSVGSLVDKLQQIYAQFAAAAQQFLTTLHKPQARSALLAASQQAKGEIADAFNALLNEALTHLTSIGTSLANVGLASILTALQGKRGLLDGFTDIWNGLTSTLGTHIDNITSSLTATGSALLGAVTPHLQDLQDQLTNHALNAAQSLLATLAGISGTLSGKRAIWDDLLAQLGGAVSSVTSSLQATGSALLGAVTPHLQDLQDQLTNHALNAAQSLLATLAGISSTLTGKRAIWDDLLAQLGGAVSSVTSSLQATGSALLGAVTPHLQDLQDQLTNHALNAAQSLLATLANISGTLSG